jgi:hypothetical protein
MDAVLGMEAVETAFFKDKFSGRAGFYVLLSSL